MGKASRSKTDGDRRARIAAQREAQRRAEQRKRIYLAGGSILVVVIVVVAIVLVKLNTGSSGGSSSNGPTGSALTSVVNDVTTIPASTTDKIAGGGVSTALFESGETAAQLATAAGANSGSYLATINGPALTSGGKPEVLYIGGEFCPFCAAERWAMVNAFSRFGTFSNLSTTHSSSTDSYPNTPTFTFYKSSYTSKYVTFTPVEQYSNTPNSAGYTILQNPTSAQNALITQYDPGTGGQGGSIPFIDFGNKYAQVGNLAPLSPSMFTNMTWADVATAMKTGTSSLATAELGNANYMTAAICELTKNQPATACTPAIQKLEADFAK
jgi:hypothetical protein